MIIIIVNLRLFFEFLNKVLVFFMIMIMIMIMIIISIIIVKQSNVTT